MDRVAVLANRGTRDKLWAMDERIIELPSERAATVLVVADTHSRPDVRCDAQFRALGPDLVLHAGDIGDLAVLDWLGRIGPLHAVRGNIDGQAPELPEALTLSLHRGGAEVLRIYMTHIAVYGPRLLEAARDAALTARADLVVCGHSHVPFVTCDRTTAVFNPGSIGPRRFGLPIVYGVLDMGERLTMRHVDCETGATWLPPGS